MGRDNCSYAGHSNRWSCPEERTYVLSPPDKLGRTRLSKVCRDALEFASWRGYLLADDDWDLRVDRAQFDDELVPMVLCKRCEVWVAVASGVQHRAPLGITRPSRCEELAKTKEIRKKAEKYATGRFQK